MTEAEWLGDEHPNPDRMLELLGAHAGPRKLRHFAVACARRVLPARADAETVAALSAAERFADGLATRWELKRAREALTRSHATRAKRWPVLYTDHIRSVPAWHTTREQIARGAAEGARVSAWSSTRQASGIMFYPSRQYKAQADLLRDIFGNPFRSAAFSPEWRTNTAVALAQQLYESRDLSAMPILADALQDAGCDSADVLTHCRTPGVHVRGCWVVDLVLGKE